MTSGRRSADSARVRVALVAIAAALLAVPAVAGAVTREARGADPADAFFDSRVPQRQAAAGRPIAASTRERSARERLGRRAALTLDPLTGTTRSVQRLGGALTGPAAGDRSAVALRWVRDNRAALGLTAADVRALTLVDRSLAPGTGFTHLRYRQSYLGIPAFDNGLRVNLDRGGRILNVTGSPVSDLRVDSIAPRLDAVAAMRALQRDVAVERAIDVTAGPSGARRTTRFAGGDFARLVLFGGGRSVRLAWHVTYRATSLAHYDAVVDAATGAILYRQNLTKSDARADVFPNHPGAPNPAVDSDFAAEGWLDANATTLEGDFVHAYSDVDDDGGPGQEIGRHNPGDDFNWPFSDFLSPPANGCTGTALCSWAPTVAGSWETNRKQNAVQAFYLANTFHDHLASPNIGFHGFEGIDKVIVETDDGAMTGPDNRHVNNANMSTPPDGESPTMQMYLFSNDDDARFRDINGGDSAAVVWHEYTHGLSNRLVTNDDGSGALSSPHAGAMGEAWSDWYALDLLHREDLEVDDPAAPGEVDIGVYTDAVFGSLRSEPIDCPVDLDVAVCPGGRNTGRGGYTFGDFGRIRGVPEVHSDGEIWAQTLWDLRTALIAAAGNDEQIGSDRAEALVTEGMRLSPPEPSFLDARNAVLAAAAGLGIDPGLVWGVFAGRGMGFFAGAVDSSDVAPHEDFSPPPAPGAPKGRITGTVTSADTGLPLANVTVGFGGLGMNHPFPGSVAPATTAQDGSYSLLAPAGRYAGLVFERGGFDRVRVADFELTGSVTRVQDVALRRDWAASSGGGLLLRDDDLYDDTGADFGCGLSKLIDQSQGTGWSAYNPDSPGNPGPGHAPMAVIALPQTIDVTAFGLDPANTCGDGASATTRAYRIDTSADGVSFAAARQGSFTMADRNRLNVVTPTANAENVRYVRLTLLSPQSAGAGQSGRIFIDFSEIAVFGGPPNVLPSGPLQVSATTIAAGQSVAFDASQVTDPDSRITGYDWDFDGDGTVDRSTAEPTTAFAYAGAGTFTAKVAVKDFRGGAGTATRQVTVTATLPSPGASPRVALPRGGSKGKVTARVTCALRCTVRGALTLSKRQARALGLKKRSAGTLRGTITRTGAQPIAATLSRAVRRSAGRRGIKRVKVTLSIAVSYADGRSTTERRVVTIKL